MQVRYDTPDENDEKRRDRNERMGVLSPEFVMPDGGEYLWSWYHDIKDGVGRIRDGVCLPIPWSELLAWAQVTQTIVRPGEYAILRAMDAAFCDETNVELEAYRERMKDPDYQPRKKSREIDDG